MRSAAGQTCRSPTMVPQNVAFSVLLPKSIHAVMPPAGGVFFIPHRISDSCSQRSRHGASVSRVSGRLSIVPGAPADQTLRGGRSAPMSHRRQILYFVLKHALLIIEEVAQRVVN